MRFQKLRGNREEGSSLVSYLMPARLPDSAKKHAPQNTCVQCFSQSLTCQSRPSGPA